MLSRAKNAQRSFIKLLLLKAKQIACLGLVSLKSEVACFWQYLYQSLGSLEACMLLPLFYFREALKIQRSCASKSVIASQTSRNRSWEGKHSFTVSWWSASTVNCWLCLFVQGWQQFLHRPVGNNSCTAGSASTPPWRFLCLFCHRALEIRVCWQCSWGFRWQRGLWICPLCGIC